MAKDFNVYIGGLPQERRKALHQEAEKIMAEEKAIKLEDFIAALLQEEQIAIQQETKRLIKKPPR